MDENEFAPPPPPRPHFHGRCPGDVPTTSAAALTAAGASSLLEWPPVELAWLDAAWAHFFANPEKCLLVAASVLLAGVVFGPLVCAHLEPADPAAKPKTHTNFACHVACAVAQ
jgi:hypothetical protein